MENKNKKYSLSGMMTVVFFSTVFIIAIFALGFFTNLVQIRGVDRKLYDMYQAYVRFIFDYSLIGIVLLVIRKAVMIQLNRKGTLIQFIISLIIAIGVIGISIYGLLNMGPFKSLYQTVNIESVQLYYPRYVYDDSIFFIGYIVNSATLLISIIFVIMASIQTFGKQKEVD